MPSQEVPAVPAVTERLEPPRAPVLSDPLPFDLTPSATDGVEIGSPRPATVVARTPLPHAAAASFPEHEPVTAKTDPPPELFSEEPTTSRALATPAPRPDSLLEVDQLLAATSAGGAEAAVDGHAPAAKDDERESQAPRASSSGVDDLLQKFVTGESRGERRVSRDLRRMVDVEMRRRPPRMLPHRHARARARRPMVCTNVPASSPRPRRNPRAPASFEAVATRPRGRAVFALAALLAVAGVFATYLWRSQPGSLSGRTAEVVDAERRAAASAALSAAANANAAACRATIVVDDLAPAAEVLIRAGVAPADLERVPAGARLEFVAVADGFAPRRSVIPAGASWDPVAGKPRYELAIQLEKSHTKQGTLDAWPAAEPGSVVGGQGPPGTVHIVTTPRGAEVGWSPAWARRPSWRTSLAVSVWSSWSPAHRGGSRTVGACAWTRPSLHRKGDEDCDHAHERAAPPGN